MHLTKQQIEWRKPRAVDAYCSSVANAANGRRLTGNEKLPGEDVVKLAFQNRNLLTLLLLARLERLTSSDDLNTSVCDSLSFHASTDECPTKARGSMIRYSESKERLA
jgi:hypothetical protein